MPALDSAGLRDCQIGAVTGLENSLAKDKPKALILMATARARP